ncbi:MAG: ShlB/FhaC/HecB family hemolysin secretion/activation protein [Ottowia sp.]|nr:ShlB/FhaC/HecB family hemolysin secretion/activation protein [Ottowia sp.]
MQSSPSEMQRTASKTAVIPAESPCYKIDHFIFEIPDSIPESIRIASTPSMPLGKFYFLNKKLAFAKGQCIGQKGINVIIEQLLLELMQRGYVTTRVGLVREQNLATGVLKISLLPGHIRAFRFDGETRANIDTAFPMKAGDILNLRDLEQGIEQIERQTSLALSMRLEPGDAPGESDIVLTLKRGKPWRVTLGFDDSGSPRTGQLQASANIALYNPLGLNDVLIVSGTHDIHQTSDIYGSQSLSAYYSVPWGNWTMTATASNNKSHFFLRPQHTHHWITEQKNIDGKIAYMFWRNQTQKNSIEMRIGKRWAHTHFGDLPLKVHQRNMTFAELAYIHRHHFGVAKLDVTTSYRWGVPWLGATDYVENAHALNYNLTIMDATLTLPFAMAGRIAYYTGTLRGQFTRTQQENSNYFSIGGRSTVRGFDSQSSFSSEQGYFFRNEVQVPLKNTRQFFYLGADVGQVFRKNAHHAPDTLTGATVGMRGTLFPGMFYDAFIAAPLYQSTAINSSTVMGLNVRYTF